MSYVKKHKYHLIALFLLLIIAGVSWRYTYHIPRTTNQISNIQYPISDTSTIEQLNNRTIEQNVSSFQFLVSNTSTALEAMKNSGINFKTKTFAGLGEFVEEINGLKNDNQNGKYWIYYINGASAKLGISTQIVKPGDLIEWKYGNTNL